MPKQGYLEKMREICDRNNIVLIFDEIITGFRVNLGGAQKIFNIVPDLAIFGKALGGGAIPVSLLAGKKSIMQLYKNRKVVHAGTFNGYPLSMTAIMSTIKILAKNNMNCYKKMEFYSKQLADILKKEAELVGLPLTIQGHCNAFYFHCTDKKLENVGDWSSNIQKKDDIIRISLLRHGILISPLSRIYINISIQDKDVIFFQEKARYALREARKIINAQFN